jgi:MFS family permease
MYIVVSIFSDRWRRRAAFMVPAAMVTAVGYAINVGVPMSMRGVLYFSVFLIAPGIYIIVGLNATWLLNSHAGYYKRATAIGMNQSMGNSAGVVVGQIFKTTVNGKYLLGLSFSLGAIVLASLGHLTLYWHFKRENRRREALTPEQREWEVVHGKGGDFDPNYKYSL